MRITNGESPALLIGAAGISPHDEISRVAASPVCQRKALSMGRAAPQVRRLWACAGNDELTGREPDAITRLRLESKTPHLDGVVWVWSAITACRDSLASVLPARLGWPSTPADSGLRYSCCPAKVDDS